MKKPIHSLFDNINKVTITSISICGKNVYKKYSDGTEVIITFDGEYQVVQPKPKEDIIKKS